MPSLLCHILGNNFTEYMSLLWMKFEIAIEIRLTLPSFDVDVMLFESKMKTNCIQFAKQTITSDGISIGLILCLRL